MATIIEQEPLYNPLPVGQDIIFTLSNSQVVSNYFNVKFVAQVYISSTIASNIALTTDLIGTFKAAPNNAGVGIFDFSAVVENHVKSDNLMTDNTYYKGTFYSASMDKPPLHITDKFTANNHSIKWLRINFTVEGSTTLSGIPAVIQNQDISTENFKIFNGYLKHTDNLEIFDNDFGYDTTGFQLVNSTSKFLTNAPVTQYANLEDYGTLGFMPVILGGATPRYSLDYIKFTYHKTDGSGTVTENIPLNMSGIYSTNVKYLLFFVGCYPANLQNYSTMFQGLVTAETIQGGFYTVQGYDEDDVAVSKQYLINVQCPDLKNYESIRLAWLNQWGAWDYYTFTKKSTRTISTQGSTYTQLEGTWNESVFKLNGYRGGKKAFRVNATEKIKMNTDFVNESESEWFEELINSPEVLMLEGFQGDSANALLNTYVTPVRLTTSSYTRKTIANDKLMQYTFEVEKSKTLRTQSI
tara:strand:+ start:166 stop:1569 length:1404 start_codon:yes stop_codon:yes gene_type:complete